jgi:hypothetical protein
MKKDWIVQNNLKWDENKEQALSQKMYNKIFEMKFLPPGRGLWYFCFIIFRAMGSKLTDERKIFASLNNCAFVSTKDLKEDLSEPFAFLMDAAMLGVG